MHVGRPYRGARVLVLGASGFIGRWVARALTRSGAEVTLAVRRADRATPILRRWGVETAPLEVDLEHDESLRDLCHGRPPSIVFNLAGYGVDPLERDEAAATALNVRLVEQLARLLDERPVRDWRGQRLVHAGSALEYGDIPGFLTETTPPHPTTLYGRSKLAGSQALAQAARASGLKAVTARLFMVYGPGEHDGRLLPHLIASARHDMPIPLTSGEQRRDFTYVEDVAEGLLRLGLATTTIQPAVVNLATGRLTAVRDVIEIAARQLGIDRDRLRLGALPTRPEEMGRVSGISIEALQGVTGWHPATGIVDGIRRTLVWEAAANGPS